MHRCPPPAKLDELLTDGLPPPESEELAAHIDTCHLCQTLLDARVRDDSLAHGLRRIERPEPSPPEVTGVTLEFARRVLQEEAAHVGERAGLPDALGPYPVRALLGEGGMGRVYLAEDSQLRRPVAVKVMRPELAHHPEARDRFLREARAAAAVRSDHVVVIHHVGEADGAPYLVMELLEGETLETRLRREGRLTTAEVVRVGREAALGLTAAHARGLVHRDVKPANVWLENRPDGPPRVKILDFGLARPGEADAALTGSGLIAGTPQYMAPEQACGEPVDARADLFALGCVLYRAATGHPPFRGPTVAAVLTAVAVDNPPPPDTLNPELPPAVAGLIMRLLAKDPAQRPASASEVVTELDRLGQETPAPRPRRRLLAGVLLSLGLIAAGVILIRDRDGREITRLDVPDGAKVTVGADGSAVVTLPGKQEPFKPAPIPKGPVPLDRLKREDISPAALALAGRGDAAKAPAELVAVLGDARFRCPMDDREIAFTRYSPDGKLLAVSCGKAVRVFDATSGVLKWHLTGHLNTVNRMAFSPDGTILATPNADDTVRLWDMATGRTLLTLPGQGDDALDAAFGPGGKQIVSCDGPGYVTLWNAATGAKLWRVRAHPKQCWAVAFSPDGKEVVSTSEDGTVGFRDVTNGRFVRALEHGDRTFHGWCPLTYSPDGRWLVSGGPKRLRIWDAVTFAERRTIETGGTSVAFGREGQTLLVMATAADPAAPHRVRRWDLATGKEMTAIDVGGRGGFVTIDLSPDCKTLAVRESLWSVVRFFDAESGKPHAVGSGHLAPTYKEAAVSPDGKLIATGGSDAVVRLWDAATGQELRALRGHSAAVIPKFSPDGQFLATASDDASVRLWRVADGRQLAEMHEHTGRPYGLRFRPDGEFLASWGEEKEILIWKLPEGKLVRKLSGHADGVQQVAYSPDGTTLASVSWDKRIIVWDAATGEKRKVLRAPAPTA